MAPTHMLLVCIADIFNQYQNTSMEPHYGTAASVSLQAATCNSAEAVHDVKENNGFETPRESHQLIRGKADTKPIDPASGSRNLIEVYLFPQITGRASKLSTYERFLVILNLRSI